MENQEKGEITMIEAILFAIGMAFVVGLVIQGGVVMPQAEVNVFTDIIGKAASTTGILAAVTDTGAQQVITTGITQPPIPSRITATTGGTAADIKAVQVVLAGYDSRGLALAETLPIFTVNTATTVTGTKVFARVTSITIPAHDGTAATTAIGYGGSPAVANTAGILPAVTDTGVAQTITTGIYQPDVPRNITATAGGTGGDVKAIQVIIAGTDIEGTAITETLPVFTVDTPGIVAGAKAFKTVTSITIPAHDGTGATTAVGFGDVLGLRKRLARNTVVSAWLAGTIESTAPTVTVSATYLDLNTVDINSTLNSTQVIVGYVETPQGV